MISSREVEKYDDKSLVNLMLYSFEDRKQNLEERVKRVFESYILSIEKIEICKDNVDKSQIKYFKKLLKQEEIKSRLLNDFGIKNFSLIKEKKIRYLQVEILSSKLKDFSKKKSKDKLTIHNIYKEYNEYLEKISDTDNLKLDKGLINAFIRFPSLLYIFKSDHQGSVFTFNINSKCKSELKIIKKIKLLDDYYEKVAKARLPYTIPDNFILPCLMIYNALLAMKNSGENELETFYGDKEVKITKQSGKLAIAFGDKEFNLESRLKSNLLISFASNSNNKTIENSFVEGILTGCIDLQEESTKLDTDSKYIWECCDERGEFSAKVVFKREQKEWCPYDPKNLNGIEAFETEFQKQLEIRRELREKINEELGKDKDRLKEQKRILKEEEESKKREEEEWKKREEEEWKKREEEEWKKREEDERTKKEEEEMEVEDNSNSTDDFYNKKNIVNENEMIENQEEHEDKKEEDKENNDSSDDFYKKKNEEKKSVNSKRKGSCSESQNSKKRNEKRKIEVEVELEDSKDVDNKDCSEEKEINEDSRCQEEGNKSIIKIKKNKEKNDISKISKKEINKISNTSNKKEIVNQFHKLSKDIEKSFDVKEVTDEDKLVDFVFMTDEQINQKVEIGIVEATQNKKTYRVRRVGDFSIAGYEDDPLIGKRPLVRSSQDDISTKPNLSSKVNKDIDENLKNFILNGAMLSIEPTKYIKKTLNTQQRASDSKQVKELVEQYSQNKKCIIEKSKEVEDILSESNFINLLKTNYEAEIKEDNIKTKNPWIQLPLSMIIMTKDFLYQNNYFNISDKAKDSDFPEILLYDPYWNFGQSEVLFKVESSSSEFNSIAKKLKCKLKKFQCKSLNYSYRSLVNFYHLNRTSFEVNKYLVALDDDSIEQLVEINDMSHLLLFMTRFELSKVKKLHLKSLEPGTYLLIEKIDFNENSPIYCIPAILPLYVIDISKKKEKKEKKKKKKKSNDSDSDEE